MSHKKPPSASTPMFFFVVLIFVTKASIRLYDFSFNLHPALFNRDQFCADLSHRTPPIQCRSLFISASRLQLSNLLPHCLDDIVSHLTREQCGHTRTASSAVDFLLHLSSADFFRCRPFATFCPRYLALAHIPDSPKLKIPLPKS